MRDWTYYRARLMDWADDAGWRLLLWTIRRRERNPAKRRGERTFNILCANGSVLGFTVNPHDPVSVREFVASIRRWQGERYVGVRYPD